MIERPFLQKVGMQLADLWTLMQIKHEVTTLADISSLGGCETQWISQDEGSDRRSRSLVCSSVMGVEDARVTSVIERERERELGWYVLCSMTPVLDSTISPLPL